MVCWSNGHLFQIKTLQLKNPSSPSKHMCSSSLGKCRRTVVPSRGTTFRRADLWGFVSWSSGFWDVRGSGFWGWRYVKVRIQGGGCSSFHGKTSRTSASAVPMGFENGKRMTQWCSNPAFPWADTSAYTFIDVLPAFTYDYSFLLFYNSVTRRISDSHSGPIEAWWI